MTRPNLLVASLTFALALMGTHALPASPVTLDGVLARATRPDQTGVEGDPDRVRGDALEELQKWPPGSPLEETAIKATFRHALHSQTGNIRNAGAWGLGRRGCSEAIPEIMALGEQDANLIGCFFQLYTMGRVVEAPLDLFRQGLHSSNPETRAAVLQAIVACKALTLGGEAERLLETDLSEFVRREAADTLWLLGRRESVPALRRSLARGGWEQEFVARGLIQLGGEAEVAEVLPLLRSPRGSLRRMVAENLAESAHLTDPRPACDALLPLLRDPSWEVQLSAVRALGHFREPRALPGFRELLTMTPRPGAWENGRVFVQAIEEIGGPNAIVLLNEMLSLGFAGQRAGLEEALVRFRDPSSGRAVWGAYLRAPIWYRPGNCIASGYEEAMDVLAVCADATLLSEIRARLNATPEEVERKALEKLLARLEARLVEEKGSVLTIDTGRQSEGMVTRVDSKN